VHEVEDFGRVVLFVAVGFSLAIASSRLTERLRVPGPAIFLLAAAVASDIFPSLGEQLSIRNVERIGVVALIVILFDGGMKVGWRHFRAAAVPITLLGVVGTFGTAAIVALFAHFLFDFGWTTAGIVGAALAPTDPAVMFSVLGRREVGGRSGTILEGESGANDPVGIALMLGMLEFATHANSSFTIVIREFAIEMTVGLAIGLAGGVALRWLMRNAPLPSQGLYPLRALASAFAIYGIAAVAHGSGFIAVFVAALLVGDARAPYKAEIVSFHASLASLAEMTVFVALGLTVDLTDIVRDRDVWLVGLLLLVAMTLVARPLSCGPLLLPVRLRRGERIFILWGGLKGAVPILLTTLAVLAGVDQSQRIYGIVFVVVLFSVLVQGGSVPYAAARLGVPMRLVEQEPWDLSIRLREEPRGVERFVVARGSRADGESLRDLALGEDTWVSLILRGGLPEQGRGSFVLEPGDEVIVLCRAGDGSGLRRVFEERR
jgi:potassium/hydrogen antiporter